MHKGGPVIYLDGLGKEREATVVEINPMHPEYVTLGYFDDQGNPQKVFDVPHMSHPTRGNVTVVKDRWGKDVEQGNTDIPWYPTNCYKERDEEHPAMPADHPAFDHPFKNPEFDQDGKRIAPVRTEYEKAIAEHVAGLAAEMEEATGVAPLPDQSLDQQKAAEEAKAKEPAPGKPRIVKGSSK